MTIEKLNTYINRLEELAVTLIEDIEDKRYDGLIDEHTLTLTESLSDLIAFGLERQNG